MRASLTLFLPVTHNFAIIRFASSLEQCVINTLQQYSVDAGRSPINTGVWVNGSKISALGVTASRWITMHGIAINLNCDLKHFQRIVPCGIDPTKGGVVRLQDLISKSIDMNVFTKQMLDSFQDVFKLELSHELTPLKTIEELEVLYPSVAALTLDQPSSSV
jgi:lipoyl(octanoyl) transferase